MGAAHSMMAGKKGRFAYLDWLKILAVLGVFLAHSIDSLDLVNWHIKYQERGVGVMIFTNFGSSWGMSLMFLLAGATAWFALGSRTGRQFVGERFNRLVIPFLTGIIFLSPVEAYFTDLNRSLYHGSFLQFYPYFFTSIQIGWNLRWLASIGFHLWFLAFLFLISVLALPLLIFLRRASCQSFIQVLAQLCEKPGAILLFGFPIVLIQVLLRAPFPGYQGWADFVTWLVCFLYGYILISNIRFEHILRHQGWIGLVTGAICFAAIAALYMAGFVAHWESNPGYSIGYVLYQILRGIVIWSMLVFVLYFVIHLLNFTNRTISYLNEALLPFYITHYPVIVFVAFCIKSWNINSGIRFLVVSAVSLGVTLALYDLLIKRIRILRRLFGMRPSSTVLFKHT